jgi:hypothetical protein
MVNRRPSYHEDVVTTMISIIIFTFICTPSLSCVNGSSVVSSGNGSNEPPPITIITSGVPVTAHFDASMIDNDCLYFALQLSPDNDTQAWPADVALEWLSSSSTSLEWIALASNEDMRPGWNGSSVVWSSSSPLLYMDINDEPWVTWLYFAAQRVQPNATGTIQFVVRFSCFAWVRSLL